MFKDKRGQGLSTNAIILIVLGVAILVMLILGFTIGWQKLLPFLGQTNVDDVATQCNLACSMNNKYDYCCKTREVKFTEDADPEEITCSGNEARLGIDKCNVDCSKFECPTSGEEENNGEGEGAEGAGETEE